MNPKDDCGEFAAPYSPHEQWKYSKSRVES